MTALSRFTRLFRSRPYAPLPPALDPAATIRAAFPGVRPSTDAEMDAMIADGVERLRGAGIARWIAQREAARTGTACRAANGRFLPGSRASEGTHR